MVYVITALSILVALLVWTCLIFWADNSVLRETLANRKETIESLKETNLLYEEAAQSWKKNFYALAEKVGLDIQAINQESNTIKVNKNTLN